MALARDIISFYECCDLGVSWKSEGLPMENFRRELVYLYGADDECQENDRR